MQTVLLCPLHEQQVSKVCTNHTCSTNPYMCKSQQCLALHEHEDSFSAIKIGQIVDMMKKEAQTLELRMQEAYDVVISEVAAFLQTQKARIKQHSSVQSGLKEIQNGNQARKRWKLFKSGNAQPSFNFKEKVMRQIQQFKKQISLKVLLMNREDKTASSEYLQSSRAYNDQDTSDPQNQTDSKAKIFQERLKIVQSNYSLIDTLEPTTSNQFVERSKIHQRQRKFEEALCDLTTALKLDTSNINAYYRRALLYTNLKKYPEAITDYTYYIIHERNSSFAYYNRAVLYILQRKNSEALQDLNKALELQPHFENAFLSRGKILLQLKSYSSAIQDFSKYIAINKGNAQAFYSRAKAYQAIGQNQSAINDFSQAIKLDPSGLNYYVDRAAIYFTLNQYSGADADYKQAIKLRPDISSLHFNRGLALVNLSSYDQAIQCFKKGLQLSPGNKTVLQSLVGLLYKLNRYAEVIQVIGTNPSATLTENMLNCRASSYKSLSNNVKALEDYTCIVEEFNSFSGLVGRGSVLILLNRNQEALKDFESAYTRGKNNINLIYNLAATLQLMNRLQEAVQKLTELLLLDQNNILALKARARLYYKLKKASQYESDLESVQRIQKTVPPK